MVDITGPGGVRLHDGPLQVIPDGTSDRDDGHLLARVAEGDRAALTVLYHRHAGVVLAHLRLVTGDHGLSEEILQDTMLAVWRGARSYQGRASVRSWIIAIARRQTRDRRRRRRLDVVHPPSWLPDNAAPGPGPEQIALDRATAREVAGAVRRLAPIHREVLSLVFGAELTLSEAAQALGIPVGTVKSRLASARAALVRGTAESGTMQNGTTENTTTENSAAEKGRA